MDKAEISSDPYNIVGQRPLNSCHHALMHKYHLQDLTTRSSNLDDPSKFLHILSLRNKAQEDHNKTKEDIGKTRTKSLRSRINPCKTYSNVLPCIDVVLALKRLHPKSWTRSLNVVSTKLNIIPD